MSLRWAYELGIALACTLALLAVLLGGELPAVIWGLLPIPAVASVMHVGGRVMPGWLGSVVALGGLLVAAFYLLFLGIGALLLAFVLAMTVILAARLLTRRALRDDLQALLISLLLVFSGAGLHTQITYGVVFVLYAVAVVWALITRELVAGAEREQAREGGTPISITLGRRDVVTPTLLAVTSSVALAILLSTSVVFVFFPRVGFGTLAFLARQRGAMPNEVALGSGARAVAGGQVIARVRPISYERFASGLYLRATTYEELTAAGFRRESAEMERRTERLPLSQSGAPLEYEVYMQPLGQQRLLTLGPLSHAEVLAGGYGNPNLRARMAWFGPAGVLQSPLPLGGPVRYLVQGYMSQAASAGASLEVLPLAVALEQSDSAWLLRLPDELDERITALVLGVVDMDWQAHEKAQAIRAFLREHFEYSLEVPSYAASSPLTGFLFEGRRGHCEHFATAFALMLRVAGVPARVAGGFAGGQYDAVDKVAVFSAADAHAWTEWYAPPHGWIVDDATPVLLEPPPHLSGLAAYMERMRRAWDDYVLEYGIAEQVEVLRRLGQALPKLSLGDMAAGRRRWDKSWLVAIGLLGLLALGWRRRSRRKAPFGVLARALSGALQRLARRPVPKQQTFRQALAEMSGHLDSHSYRLLVEALEVYEQQRFGRRAVSNLQVRRLTKALRRLRKVNAKAPHAV